MNPIEIYNEFLIKKDKEHKLERAKDNPDMYEASSSGLCIKKHYYRKMGAKQKGADVDGLRIMRLGTIMGEDFARGIDEKAKENPDYKFYQETLLKSDYLGVAGHLDLLIVDKEGNGSLYDWKTANSFKYKNVFNHKNPTINNELQVGTYASMSIESGLCDKIVHLGLLYYNKNDSKMEEKVLDLNIIQEAERYWINARHFVKEHIESRIEPKMENGMVPVYKWECGKYCNYSDICDCPLNKLYKGGKL